jgi:GT2 family glycosyltransferase
MEGVSGAASLIRPNPRVAVIVLALDRYDLTVACIDALRRTTRPGSYHLVVIDNGSTDGMRAFEDADTVIHNPTNLGFAAGCNQGAAAVPDAEVLVFLNNDAETAPNWLPAMLRSLRMPRTGIAGGFLHYPGGATQHAGVEFMNSPPIVAVNIQELRPPGYVPATTGAFMAVRREAFDAVGGFDEGYWNGYEDVDLCLKVRQAGWQTYYSPDAQAMHHESASGPERWAAVGNNIDRLQSKWGYLAEASERNTAILIPSMRAHLLPPLLDNIAATTPEQHWVYLMLEWQSDCDRAVGGRDDVTILYDEGDTWGHRLNAMLHWTYEPYLFCAADDVEFHPGWLTEALNVMGTMHGVVSVADRVSAQGTLPLISRRYIDQWSGCLDVPDVIIHPAYHHNYSETELYETARTRGRWLKAEQSVVEHHHPLVGTAAEDEVYALGRSRVTHDEYLFNERANRLWRGIPK